MWTLAQREHFPLAFRFSYTSDDTHSAGGKSDGFRPPFGFGLSGFGAFFGASFDSEMDDRYPRFLPPF
jgi:hypothetical protein